MTDLLEIMATPEPYPYAAGYKRDGTSSDAAAYVDAGTLRGQVLASLRVQGPATADEVAARINIDRLSIRPRLSELQHLGKVRDSGLRRRNASGRYAMVFEALQ